MLLREQNTAGDPRSRAIFGKAAFALTDDIQFSMQGTYNNRRSEQLIAAMPVVLGSGPGAGTQARTISISSFIWSSGIRSFTISFEIKNTQNLCLFQLPSNLVQKSLFGFTPTHMSK